MRKFPVIAAVAGAAAVPILAVVGCFFIRPYDVPEFVEVGASESAFLIPLEGDTANQAAFNSVKFLEEKKIATKRVQISHRWQQTGYLPRLRRLPADRAFGQSGSSAHHARMDEVAESARRARMKRSRSNRRKASTSRWG